MYCNQTWDLWVSPYINYSCLIRCIVHSTNHEIFCYWVEIWGLVWNGLIRVLWRKLGLHTSQDLCCHRIILGDVSQKKEGPWGGGMQWHSLYVCMLYLFVSPLKAGLQRDTCVLACPSVCDTFCDVHHLKWHTSVAWNTVVNLMVIDIHTYMWNFKIEKLNASLFYPTVISGLDF